MKEVFKKAFWSGVVMALGSLLAMCLENHRKKRAEEERDRERQKHLAAVQAEHDIWLKTMKQAKEMGIDITPNANTVLASAGNTSNC